MVAGRMFLRNSAKYGDGPPAFLSVTRHGLVVCGGNANARIAKIGRSAPIPLMAARAVSLQAPAHHERPDGWPIAWGNCGFA
jgi:hypothetical protein